MPDNDSEVKETDPSKDEIVTDVVPEQVAAGDAEPAPTPAMGQATETGPEEVDATGGLEKLDEEVEKVKEQEEGEDAHSADAEMTDATSQLKVEEADGEAPKVSDAPVTSDSVAEDTQTSAPAPPAEEKKQERVENPTYTLEVVGNRYNPSNFWCVSSQLGDKGQLA